jgi:Fur family ferric uptake transcriptional regulator
MADSHADEVAAIRARIRATGLRSTSARIAVLQHLQAARAPLTHAEIADELVPLGFDKATVYRNLIDLTDAGIVSRSELGDHVWRFEVRGEGAAHDGEHPHFVCVSCGSVTCLGDVKITPTKKKEWADIADISEVLLKGHCVNCA